MREERPLVLHQLVEHAVEIILRRQRKVLLEKVAHRRLIKTQPMQPPLAARIDQAIRAQSHQRVIPGSPLAAVRQERTPKRIEVQLLRQLHQEPARTPLPGPHQVSSFVSPHSEFAILISPPPDQTV
jgi:hypothetical protein